MPTHRGSPPSFVPLRPNAIPPPVSPVAAPSLDRAVMTTAGMVTKALAASGPLIVLFGSIPATFAATGVLGVPLGFLIVGAVAGLLSVGYSAMARAYPHPAPCYAIAARGLGRASGVACGAVALVAYCGIQTSLYGLLGATVQDALGVPWWLTAAIAVLIVGVLGVRRVVLSTGLLAVVLGISAIFIALFFAAAFAEADRFSAAAFEPNALHAAGLGTVIAYGFAALMGFEIPFCFGEESRTRTGPSRAVGIALVILVALYAGMAWAITAGVGAAGVAAVAPVPGAPGPYYFVEREFTIIAVFYLRVVLVLAIGTSMLSLHSIAARYAFALAREQILPKPIAWTGRNPESNSPVGGSLLQSGIAALIVAGFAVSAADPLATLFAWNSTLGALGFVTLLLISSVAAMVHLRAHRAHAETLWRRRIAPALGVLGGLGVLGAMGLEADAMLGVPPGSPLLVVVPGLIVGAALTGLAWALFLRSRRPGVYAGIGGGMSHRHAVPDMRLAAKYRL